VSENPKKRQPTLESTNKTLKRKALEYVKRSEREKKKMKKDESDADMNENDERIVRKVERVNECDGRRRD
jgi:hypothetical protein